MPTKCKKPWKAKTFLRANVQEQTVSVSWEFKLELMERVSKIIAGLHRKNRAYGHASLTADNIYILASDRVGLKALNNYPPVHATSLDVTDLPSFSENDGELAKIDQLCLGVFLLEMVSERPLDGKRVPQLIELLKRKGLGNIEIITAKGKMKKITSLKEKDLIERDTLQTRVKKQLVERELIKEDLKRSDYDPEPESRIEEVELYKSQFETVRVSTKSTKSGSHRIQVSQKGLKKAQFFMNKFLKNAQKSIQALGRNLNKRRKNIHFPRWANVQRLYIPRLQNPVDEDGRVSRNLIRENDIMERRVDEELQSRVLEKETKSGDKNDYVMSTIIKEEVRLYLESLTDIKKPTWMLNLYELVLQLLTPVDDSRPTAKAARNWLLEVVESFEVNKKKHGKVKEVVNSPEYKKMEKKEKKKNNIFALRSGAKKGDYVSNIEAFDIIYQTIAVEESFKGIKREKGEVLLYHSTDVVGEYVDSDEDNMSVDSHQPPEKDYIAITPKELGSTSGLLIVDKNAKTRIEYPMSRLETTATTEFVMEKEPPPIFGPQADKLLDKMEEERGKVGDILKPSEVAKLFDEQKKMPHQKVISLLKKAKHVFNKEPNILNIDAPAIVVGDIHGQYFDLRQVIKFCGKPKKTKQTESNPPRASANSRRSRADRKQKRASRNGYLTKLGFKKGKGTLNAKDKVVLNKDEFNLEKKKLSRTFSNPQIAAGAVPPPMTKPLTLGRKLVEEVTEDSARIQSNILDNDEAKQKGRTFLFLGDYVDRGNWSCEVLFYLLSLKVHYPESVIMLRGNHECDKMAENYGFRAECYVKYGREVYHRCVQVFNNLPIACLINLPNGKRFFGCHGGISEKVLSLEQIARCQRRRDPGVEGVLCDLLWSDPVPDNVVEELNLPIQFENIDFIPNETRGCSKKFGYRALENFLDANELVGIVRAHEAKEEGFHFHFQNAGTKDHLCITVFSAPNYMLEYGNKGAVLIIHKTVKDRLLHQMQRLKYKYTVDQILQQPDKQKDDYLDLLEPICYNEVAQPEVVNFDNQNMTVVQQIEETCPYMPTIIDEFYNSSLDILERYGTAQQQLELYAKEQEAKKKAAEEDLEETKKEKAKLKFGVQNGRKVWHSVKLNSAVFNKMNKKRKQGIPGKKQSKTRFIKTLKKVNEQHPQVLNEKIRAASAKLEEMEKRAVKAQDDEDVKLLTEGVRTIGFDNISTLKRGRSLSAGVSPEKKAEILRNLRNSKKKSIETSEASEDNKVIVSQIQKRRKMKRERVEIDFKEEWLQLLASWFSTFAGEEIFAEHLFDELHDCVLLCHAATHVLERPDLKFYKPPLNGKLTSFEVRRNLIVFQDCCKDLGITYMFLIFDLTNYEYNYVLPALIQLVTKAKREKKLTLTYDPHFPEHLYEKGMMKGVRETLDLKAEDDKLEEKGLEVGNVTFNGGERLTIQLLFLMIDIFDSGFITSEGIIKWAEEEGKLIRPEHAAQVISAIDYDNDGSIGLRDFFQYAARLKEEFANEAYAEEFGEVENDGEDPMLFQNQQSGSGEFGGQADPGTVFDPSSPVDMAKFKLDMGDEEKKE